MNPHAREATQRGVDRILEAGAVAMALAGGLVLLTITAVTVANVGAFGLDRLARLVGGSVSGLPGYEDFVRLSVGSAILLMLPYCQYMRGHVAVDLFVNLMPGPVSWAIDRIALALVATLAAFLAYWMTEGMLEVRADGLVSRVLGWPEWPFYVPGIAALLLWGMIALRQLFQGRSHG